MQQSPWHEVGGQFIFLNPGSVIDLQHQSYLPKAMMYEFINFLKYISPYIFVKLFYELSYYTHTHNTFLTINI